MTYSTMGILAIILLLISNGDILFHRDAYALNGTWRNYRAFLISVLGYYISDVIWGILYSYHLIAALYIDTSVYFVTMGTAVMFWTKYAISYLATKSLFNRVLHFAGHFFLGVDLLLIVVNFFYPVLFWFEGIVYKPSIARSLAFSFQILMYFLTSIYTLTVAAKSKEKIKRRNLTIGFFGIAMALSGVLQMCYPLLPLYAAGYMMGISLLRTFVLEDEKEEHRRELEESRMALQAALKDAENASIAKTAFLSNMSHEIRTPMNAIIGLNNIAMNDSSVSKEVKSCLKKIDSSARHLLGIINDILDMSRIESGRMTIKSEVFSFAQAIEQISTMIGGQCRDKGLNYNCSIKGKVDDYYIGDVMKFKQVMINILGNAVKFTPKGGSVTFVVEEGTKMNSHASLKFTISDTGIGMSQEFLPHIFEAFSQEDSSSKNVFGSTGLGMSITKSLVELMNGNISVESQKGKGSKFTVLLTFGKAEQTELPEEPKRPAKHRASLKGRRVLIVEDSDINAEIMTKILSCRGIKTELACNGKIAVESFDEKGEGYYDAILMDIRMPVMDGLEATREIRAKGSDYARDVPIIALTANAFDEDVQRSMQAGLNAHLSKPVEADMVFKTLEELIQ